MMEDIIELKRKGALDEGRLKEKVREAIRKDIQKYIVEEAIVTGSGDRKVKIPIKGLELPQFRFGSNQGGSGLGSGLEGVPAGLEEQAERLLVPRLETADQLAFVRNALGCHGHFPIFQRLYRDGDLFSPVPVLIFTEQFRSPPDSRRNSTGCSERKQSLMLSLQHLI